MGVVSSGVCVPATLFLYDSYEKASWALAQKLPGSNIAGDLSGASEGMDVVLVCVKPQDMGKALERIANLETKALIISVAAGVACSVVEQALGEGARVARVMPNTPALIGKGASAFSLGKYASLEDAGIVHRLLEGVGEVVEVPETMMDAVTGLSGSGPAYAYTIIEAMADGGVRMGLPRNVSINLAAQTVLGAAAMVLEGDKHPAELRDEVTSPGGTTIAGLAALEAAGLRGALIGAVTAAAEKSAELNG